jgi:CCR4-NOT transcriptional complex subunit CAF120
MERSRFKTEEWVRVRFGAGVPWRRCWCVISPPDEKEFLKLQKDLKKRSPYDRSAVPVLKGDIKFYDTRKDGKKQKKAQPIATITDAYSAYAIYPQAKSLVDASTLLKIEGTITVHSEPATTNEGFVFIMPEVRPMVSGFEMLLRFLFPTWDAFGLYGRPGKLVASILDPRSLMFAMPKHRRYGYLEPQDVTALIDDASSGTWNEGEWRKRLKEATGTRMNNRDDSADDSRSRSNSRGSGQPAFGGDALGGRPRVGFTDDAASVRSRSQSLTQPNRTDSAPLEAQRNRHHPPMPGAPYGHARNTSDPDFGGPNQGPPGNYGAMRGIMQDRSNTMSSDEERHGTPPIRDLGAMRNLNTPEPVSTPPQFGHANGNPSSRMSKAYHSPELRRANSRLSNGTLHQLATAGGLAVRDGTTAGNSPQRRNVGDGAIPGPSVHPHAANSMGTSANDDRSREALRQPQQPRPPALNIPSNRSESPAGRSPYGPPSPYTHGPNSPALTEGRRSPFPPGPSGPPGGGPPRSPGFRPDQSRPPPQGRGGPGGPPSQGGRGRPPPNMNGPSPEYYGRGRGSPGPGPGPGPGPNPYSGPHGSQANPNARNLGLPDRSTSLNKHKSVTPNEIIDHYTSDGGYDHLDRPRAGVLKTVGGGETAPAPRQNFDIPDVDFGPTFNYGARQGGPNQRGPPPPGGPQPQRPYSPAGPRPSTAGRNSPANPPHQVHRRPVETASQRVPWQPGGPAPGPGANSVSPEQYVQQRAADNSHRRRSSHDLMNSGHVRHESADTMQRPSTSGGPLAERDAWATDHRHHQQPPAVPFGQQGMADRSMSPRPTTPGGGRGGAPYGGYNQGPRPGPQEGQPMRQGDPRYMPPQGQFSPAPPPHAGPRNVHPQYQGQAF